MKSKLFNEHQKEKIENDLLVACERFVKDRRPHTHKNQLQVMVQKRFGYKRLPIFP